MLIHGKLYRPKHLNRLIRAPRTAYPSLFWLAIPPPPIADNREIEARGVILTPIIAAIYHNSAFILLIVV